MCIQAQWDTQDPDILVFDLRCDWTWNMFHTTAQEVAATISAVNHPVYVMTLSAPHFPPSPSVLSEFQKVSRVLPSNIALIVVVTDNYMIRAVNEVFFRVSPLAQRIGRLAKTPDAARQLIAEHRAKRVS